MNVDEIQKQIADLFTEYGYPVLTRKLDFRKSLTWVETQARRLKIDEEVLVDRFWSLLWAVAHVQFGLGYALVARQSVRSPHGGKGTVYWPTDVPDYIGLPDMHVWYHIYSTVECLYRCWERLAVLLRGACFPSSSENLYFNQVVDKIKGDARLQANAALASLEAQVKNWNVIAGLRNAISHDDSSPFKEVKIEGGVSDILGARGEPVFKFDYSYTSIRQELDKLKDHFSKLEPAIEAVQGFIESM